MYVCICHAVTDRQITAAAARGITRLRDLKRDLGVPGNCGRCAQCARDLLRAGATQCPTLGHLHATSATA
ncbi:hypothetical protein CKO25_05780 [Thiocapsa imhoffii]|uniref:Bacterioferritin-associated ferredoxin n=1 Tax=Thiocapsa imhoffii TaxID=382777 RepID=A0A9X0WGN6_9GAMM|nr:(2Fe-2S)-binding protein [Thiocapsa imhoffii]MBK1644170.1 hypothetical protein [Thiocapsa imhoffii]